MIVKVNHGFEHRSETSEFLIDTKKLADIDSFKTSFDGQLDRIDLGSVDEYRKIIKDKLESALDDNFIMWGEYTDSYGHGELSFTELISGSEVEQPVRIIKNVTVFESLKD